MKRKLSLVITLAAVFLFALFAGPVYGGVDGQERADQARQRHTDGCWVNLAWSG